MNFPVNICHHQCKTSYTRLRFLGALLSSGGHAQLSAFGSHNLIVCPWSNFHQPIPHLQDRASKANTIRFYILCEFPALSRPCNFLQVVKHNGTHHILTKWPPVVGRPRRLAPEHLTIAKREFEHMLDMGIIRPSSSSWSSALHVVPKSTPQGWQPCGDYRALNNVTVPDQYPIPRIHAIDDFPQPNTVKRLREFLGLVDFYRQFKPHCATTLHSLTEMLKKPQAQTTILNGTTANMRGFSQS